MLDKVKHSVTVMLVTKLAEFAELDELLILVTKNESVTKILNLL